MAAPRRQRRDHLLGRVPPRRSDAVRAVRGANLDNEWTFDRDTVRGDDE